MTNLELKQLRQLFFLSQAEAAEHIGNVEVRSWQRWEKGTHAIPCDVIQKVQMISLIYHDLISVEPDLSHYNYQYFDSLDEYEKASNVRSVIQWRLSQSISAQLLSEKLASIWRVEETINDED
ncbi:YdiL family protein [Proteus mirabilis]|uniref:YdiL family protein n=1 Tax=Proteus mirabilis TaxID=584 RepID=UPI00217F148B|nr:YdiL family protein [Proteus mirabilis]MCS6741702.1 YdiL family protein [Acinetobacter baumannii]EKW7428837.1 DUF1870 family protein [Proteus mirabilis]MCS6721220.1 YdiL family protein [Proteus mirabilis]MCS6727931.1 YdiL family protein [Proteus mirabilis]MCS6736787.1 YdiL family protein [Proteus mirabilis]